MKRTASAGQINILIKLSSILISHGLQALLRPHPAEFLVEVAADLTGPTAFQPELILVDTHTVIEENYYQWPDAKLVLMYLGVPRKEIITLLITHKVHGVIEPYTDLPLFRKALRSIHSGQIWIDNGKLKALLHDDTFSVKPSVGTLSKKEREIVLLIAEGLKNREIAERLHVSEQTVKAHLNHIFKKEGVTSRSQLVPLALKL